MKVAERKAVAERNAQEREAHERSSPSGTVVYKAVLAEGDAELKRPTSALFWSGLAAGLSMGFSLITEGLLQSDLPDAKWTPTISKFGYSVGFVIVVLGRQQLFTENTLTPMLPLLLRRDRSTLLNVMRLWAVVLFANLLGALAIAFVLAKTSAMDAPVKQAFAAIGRYPLDFSFTTLMLRGIFAGWLLALMVWVLPFAEAGRVWVIILLTYLVGLGHFPHVIAGAVNEFTLACMGDAPWTRIILNYLLPTLIGNVIGGVTLVAAINHAQIVSGNVENNI